MPATQTPDPAAWPDNNITLEWHGHATVLINFYEVHVLTDPALFRRIGVDLRRQRWAHCGSPCALPAAQLAGIHVVLLSYAHFDHLDTASLGAMRGHSVARDDHAVERQSRAAAIRAFA